MPMKVRYTVIDGEVISEERDGVQRLYVSDPLGSTVALVDASTQTVTDTFSYWPYGEEASRTGTTPTPFRFVGMQGYYRDSASLTYVRARYLSTRNARWLTQDPIGFDGGDTNLYRYAENNPVGWTDATGTRCAKRDKYLDIECKPCASCFRWIPSSCQAARGTYWTKCANEQCKMLCQNNYDISLKEPYETCLRACNSLKNGKGGKFYTPHNPDGKPIECGCKEKSRKGGRIEICCFCKHMPPATI